MKTITSFFLAVATFWSIGADAQYYRSGSTVNYRVLRDDPDNLRPVVLSLDVLTADTWNLDGYLGYGMRADVNLKKYGTVIMDYRKGYLGSKQRAIELGGALNLFCSRKKVNTRVVLSSSSFAYGSNLFTSATSISVPGIKKTVLQARGGIASFKTDIDIFADDAEGFEMIKDTNRVQMDDFGKNYRGVSGFTALMKMQTYYVGLSIRTISNLVIAHDRGLGSNSNNYNFYADALFGGGQDFSNVNYRYSSDLYARGFPKGTKPDEYTVSGVNVKKIGWRAGWEAKTNNGFGMSYKAEFGSRPGYKIGGFIKSNTYVMLAAGFSIGAGKSYKKITPQEKE